MTEKQIVEEIGKELYLYFRSGYGIEIYRNGYGDYVALNESYWNGMCYGGCYFCDKYGHAIEETDEIDLAPVELVHCDESGEVDYVELIGYIAGRNGIYYNA